MMYKESEGESGGESRYVSLNICILCHLSEKEKIEREGNNSNKSKEGERERERERGLYVHSSL